MKRFLRSFVYAGAGIRSFFRTEKNAQVHLFVAILVVAAGFYFDISFPEWAILLICMALVIAFEMINTAIEKLCDSVTTEITPTIKLVKDVSAGAVLIVSIAAAMIGIGLFWPYISELFGWQKL